MKKLFAILIVFNFLMCNNFKDDAQQWTKKLLKCATDQELQLIANLFYFSYLRSHQTLESQKILLSFMQKTNKQYLSFIATRRDPLHHHEFIDANLLTPLFEEAKRAYLAHNFLGNTYDFVVKYTVNEQILSSECFTLVNQVRQAARTAVMKACTQQVAEKTEVLLKTQNLLQHAAEFYGEQHFFVKRSLLNTLAGYIPPIALKLFIQFDENMITAQQQFLRAWEEMQRFNNAVWEIIEKTRQELYGAYYNALFQAMQNKPISKTWRTIIFDEKGIITNSQCQDPLPAYL